VFGFCVDVKLYEYDCVSARENFATTIGRGIDMKSWLLALALLTAAAQASAQQTTQGQMCAEVAVMPPPAGDAQNRMLSDDAEVADRVGVSKSLITPDQAMATGQVVRAGLLHHVAVEYRRSPTPPMVHTRMAEFFYVVDGEADLVLGGTLINPRSRTRPTWRATVWRAESLIT